MLKEVLSAPFDLGDRNVRLSASFGFAVYPFAGEDVRRPVEERRYRALSLEAPRPRPDHRLFPGDRPGDEARDAARAGAAQRDHRRRGRRALPADRRSAQRRGRSASRPWRAGATPTSAMSRRPCSCLSQKSAASSTRCPRRCCARLPQAALVLAEGALPVVQPVLGTADGSGDEQHVLLAIISQVGLDPRRLELEITETAVMADADTAQKIVTELRAAGVRVSLDDFGTGQSSLGRLRDFSFDKVKIDRGLRLADFRRPGLRAYHQGDRVDVRGPGTRSGRRRHRGFFRGAEAEGARLRHGAGLLLRQARRCRRDDALPFGPLSRHTAAQL